MRLDKSSVDEDTIKALVSDFGELIRHSGLTQNEIAEQLSDDKRQYTPTFISLMKAGKTKIPVYLTPKLADLFGIDKWGFLMRALDAYHPEVRELIECYMPTSTTVRERQVLDEWRRSGRESDKPLGELQRGKLAGFFAAL